jgi:hypothetical protein
MPSCKRVCEALPAAACSDSFGELEQLANRQTVKLSAIALVHLVLIVMLNPFILPPTTFHLGEAYWLQQMLFRLSPATLPTGLQKIQQITRLYPQAAEFRRL